ncbi:MAG: HlyC/CorC family transporter [Lachnospiraceae bacterium]|nr:HlyC/CorC family transporter [Lachnospiraceae bacterium]
MQGNSITLIIIIFCIVMSAYFSATETAFSSLNRIRIKNLADKGNKRAALVARLSEKYDSMLSTILIGNNIVNIGCSSLATVLFLKWLGEEAGPSVSTAVTTVVVLIFGEVSPKSIAKESPEKFAMFSAPILNVLMIILTPFNYLFGLWKKLLSKIIKSDEDRGITEEEILTIVEEATQEGGINEQEGSLIRSAIEFTEMEAGDVLTPRIDVEGVELHASKEEIAEVFTETSYSRLPVYEESMDHIVGIIYHKDFHNYVYHTEQDVSSIMRPARFITKTKKIGDLLKELQKEKSHIAVVLDEFGGTIGIVTLEDILEELVGEIWDEHDEIIEAIVKKAEDEYMVLGSANVEKLFEELDIEEEVDVVTVSGWVMNLLERIPKENDKATYGDWEIMVLEMNGKRIEKVQIKKI